MSDNVLMSYYIKYLKDIREVSDSTVSHYIQALRYISKYLAEKKMISETIYEIEDIGELEIIKTHLYNDPDFVALDERGHRMYSAGLNNYFKFAKGEGLANIHEKIALLDLEVPVNEKVSRMIITRNRSSIIKIQSIESAGYECELYPEHQTFTSKSTGHPYMEAHHATTC